MPPHYSIEKYRNIDTQNISLLVLSQGTIKNPKDVQLANDSGSRCGEANQTVFVGS